MKGSLTMGMAASQARLLTITARLADNELRSQTINNAKMRLATESAQASDDYITALNNARMMFKNVDLTGTSQTQLLTFNSLTSYSPYNTQYGLVNSAGLLLVSEDEAKIFEKSGNILEKFLENHGLKWDTTYFDEDKNVIERLKSYYSDDVFKLHQKPDDYETNPTSPEAIAYDNDPGLSFLFDRVNENGEVEPLTRENLRELYEDYLRNDFSIERASFNTAQAEYTSEKRVLYSNAVEDIWDKLKTQTGKTSLSDIADKFNATSGAEVISELAGYGIGYLSDDFISWAGGLNVGNDSPAGSNWSSFITTEPEGIPPANFNTGEKGEEPYTDCDIYQVGTLKFYVDENNNVKGISSTYDGQETIKYTLGGTEYNLNKDSDVQQLSSGQWPDIVNNFVENGTNLSSGEFQNSYYIKDGNIVTRTYYNSPTSAANAIVLEVLSSITSEYEALDLDKYVDMAGTAYARNYIDSRNEFYKLIFEDYEYDPNETNENNIKKFFNDFKDKYPDLFDNDAINIDSMQSLYDFTIFLQYVHEYQTTHNGEPKYTSAFQNIVDAFTVELMRDELGEPKYAWVDSADKSLNEENADAKAQWYENLFNRMRKGYAIIEDGLASSADWIEHAFEAGIVTMEQVDKSYNWVSLDYKCCANITEDTDNSAAVAIAEAKYNRAMNDIKRKDNMFDMQLKNIDTEHNALQTEYDVIKGVIAKNIERTMKFDQSA